MHWWGKTPQSTPLVIENRLHELDKDLDRLLTMDGSEIVDLRIKQTSDEMLQLRQMKKRAELDAQQDMGRKRKAMEIMDFISAEDLDLTEYSDTLVYGERRNPHPLHRWVWTHAAPSLRSRHREMLAAWALPASLCACFSR